MDKFSWWEPQKWIKSFLLLGECETRLSEASGEIWDTPESLPLAQNHIIKEKPTSSQIFPGVEKG